KRCPYYYDNIAHTPELDIYALKCGYTNYTNITNINNNTKLAIYHKLFGITLLDQITDEMNVNAIKKLYILHKFINVKSPNVVLCMIKYDYRNIKLIEKPSDEFLMQAVAVNPMVLSMLNNPSRQICLETMKYNGNMIKYVK